LIVGANPAGGCASSLNVHDKTYKIFWPLHIDLVTKFSWKWHAAKLVSRYTGKINKLPEGLAEFNKPVELTAA
jgi:hypothetical protein